MRVKTRGRILVLGRNWDKSLKRFPLSKSGLKLAYNVSGNLKSENSQDYAQKPQRNCTFMNSASVGVVNTAQDPCTSFRTTDIHTQNKVGKKIFLKSANR